MQYGNKVSEVSELLLQTKVRAAFAHANIDESVEIYQGSVVTLNMQVYQLVTHYGLEFDQCLRRSQERANRMVP